MLSEASVETHPHLAGEINPTDPLDVSAPSSDDRFHSTASHQQIKGTGSYQELIYDPPLHDVMMLSLNQFY